MTQIHKCMQFVINMLIQTGNEGGEASIVSGATLCCGIRHHERKSVSYSCSYSSAATAQRCHTPDAAAVALPAVYGLSGTVEHTAKHVSRYRRFQNLHKYTVVKRVHSENDLDSLVQMRGVSDSACYH